MIQSKGTFFELHLIAETISEEKNWYSLERHVQKCAGYRFGFNGMERDDKAYGEGNSYTAEYWQYDSRLGRRWNVDPVTKPHRSAYDALSQIVQLY